MKQPRTSRVAPRTLSAPPLPSLRAPKSSAYQARFPSLVAVIAGGALVPACHDVECGSTRAEELQAHGADEGLRELGVALGVVSHTETRAPISGGIRPVATPPIVSTPPAPPSPPTTPPEFTMGERMPVGPTPVNVAPPTAPTRVTPPASPHAPHAPTHIRSQPRGGARRIEPQAPVDGGLGAAGPLPLDVTPLSTRRV
jgi:hypothetical protein